MIPTLSFTMPAVTSSAEVTGTVNLQPGVSYSFFCSFDGASIAFLWIDDHLVCQIGAYLNSSISLAPTPPTLAWGQDNPATVYRKTPSPVRLHIYKLPDGVSSKYVCSGVVFVCRVCADVEVCSECRCRC